MHAKKLRAACSLTDPGTSLPLKLFAIGPVSKGRGTIYSDDDDDDEKKEGAREGEDTDGERTKN